MVHCSHCISLTCSLDFALCFSFPFFFSLSPCYICVWVTADFAFKEPTYTHTIHPTDRPTVHRFQCVCVFFAIELSAPNERISLFASQFSLSRGENSTGEFTYKLHTYIDWIQFSMQTVNWIIFKGNRSCCMHIAHVCRLCSVHWLRCFLHCDCIRSAPSHLCFIIWQLTNIEPIHQLLDPLEWAWTWIYPVWIVEKFWSFEVIQLLINLSL